VWVGVASLPAPGSAIDPAARDARLAVLREYYQGPVANHFGRPVYSSYHSAQKEADIVWVLEYFEP
jgi:hypothetical protein